MVSQGKIWLIDCNRAILSKKYSQKCQLSSSHPIVSRFFSRSIIPYSTFARTRISALSCKISVRINVVCMTRVCLFVFACIPIDDALVTVVIVYPQIIGGGCFHHRRSSAGVASDLSCSSCGASPSAVKSVQITNQLLSDTQPGCWGRVCSCSGDGPTPLRYICTRTILQSGKMKKCER